MERRVYGTAIGLIGVSTLVITSSLVGVISLGTDGVAGLADRVPFYVLGGALVFTGLLVALELRIEDGTKIITTSIAIAVCAFVVIGLSAEGFLFAIANPDRILSNIILYVFAAGLISTGLIFWAVRHWREFTTSGPPARRGRR